VVGLESADIASWQSWYVADFEEAGPSLVWAYSPNRTPLEAASVWRHSHDSVPLRDVPQMVSHGEYLDLGGVSGPIGEA